MMASVVMTVILALAILAALFLVWASVPTQARWEAEDKRRRARNDVLAAEMVRQYHEAQANPR